MAWLRTTCSDWTDVEVEWVAAAASEGESGIVAVRLMTPSDVVRLD